MREISLHILDIAKNSTKAGATLIRILLEVSERKDELRFTISDNGKGMSREFLEKVTDPFTTTRTTRKVGLGLPLLKLAAETAGGNFHIASEEGVGTTVSAAFRLHHIDRMPLGDYAATVSAIVSGDADRNFVFEVVSDAGSFSLDTREMREELGDVSLAEPEITEFIRSFMQENLTQLFGGEWNEVIG